MPIVTEVRVHDAVTGLHGYRYQFTPKHHGGDPSAAQWRESLSFEEEFQVFNLADERELFDETGNLYGIQLDGQGRLSSLGSRREQIAKFPVTRAGEPWHGYPLYPLLEAGLENRRGQKGMPPKVVFDRMLQAHLISRGQRRRLLKARHA